MRPFATIVVALASVFALCSAVPVDPHATADSGLAAAKPVLPGNGDKATPEFINPIAWPIMCSIVHGVEQCFRRGIRYPAPPCKKCI